MTTRDVLIGVDAGTSVIKAVAFDLDGAQIASASRPNRYATLPNGGAEQDMARTWADTAAVLCDLGDGLPGLRDRVLALAVTGQGDGTWLIDAAGEPVHDGWLWLDARAAAETRRLAASPGIGTIYRQTGTGVNISQMRTQLTWMKAHAPDLLSRAATAFHCKDWLYFKMTGVRATDPTEAVFTFGDFRTRAYDDAVIAALDLSELSGLMPPIVDGSRTTHPLTQTAAAATGLPAGMPVSLGCVDVMCTALGGGLHDADAAPGLSILGSTGMHMRFVPNADAVHLNEDRSGYTMAFPGRALAQMQTNMAATLNIDWMLDLAVEMLAAEGVSRSRADLLAGLDDRVLAARPGAAMYHPYISSAGERGPFSEPDARASFTGLDQRTGWFDMMRGVFDGLVLAARDCFVSMGPIPREIRVSGGAARSGALRLFLASALGAPVRTVDQPEAGAAGACMMAAVAAGVHADIERCAAAWTRSRIGSAVQPDAALAATYDALWEGYRATRTAMEPVWQAQATMRGRMP